MEGVRYSLPLCTDLQSETTKKADLFLDRTPEKPNNSEGKRKQVPLHVPAAQWVHNPRRSHNSRFLIALGRRCRL